MGDIACEHASAVGNVFELSADGKEPFASRDFAAWFVPVGFTERSDLDSKANIKEKLDIKESLELGFE